MGIGGSFMTHHRLTRRQFLKGAAIAAGGTVLAPGISRGERRPKTWHGTEKVEEIPST